MGIVDLAAKDFLKEPEIFADAFNHLLYDGEPVIRPQDMKERDPELLMGILEDESDAGAAIGEPKKKQTVKGGRKTSYLARYRDALKQTIIMDNGEATMVMLGIEEQTTVLYGLCVKIMLYDAMQYADQIKAWKQKHIRDGKSGQGGAFLEGLHKEDRLAPVITLVLYLGQEPYDGAVHLVDLLDVKDRRLLPFIQDYRVYLLNPQTMSEERLRLFDSDLGPVLRFLKYRRDRKKLNEILYESDVYRHISGKAGRLITACTGKTIETQHESEVDVVTIWEEQFKYGEQQGMQQGIQQGMQQGIQQGTELGDRNRRMKSARTMLADGALSHEQIARYTELSLEQVKELAAELTA